MNPRIIIGILLALNIATAMPAGQNDGEIILDEAENYKTRAGTHPDIGIIDFIPGGKLIKKGTEVLVSSTSDDFENQFKNKEQAQNQNKELLAAKENLQNSKENITTVFFFIVTTLVIVFDAIISIIYILFMVLLIWILFVGYAKTLIIIIDFISGKIEQRGVRF